MNGDRPDRPPLVALLETLDVRRNATVGFGTGLLVGSAAYLFRVLELWGPVAGGQEYPLFGADGWFLALAFVLAVTFGGLVTAALLVRAAVRETKELSESESAERS